jgi:hypothetical protein
MRLPLSRRRRPLLLAAAVACTAAMTAGGTAVADVIWGKSGPYAGTKRFYRVITAKHSGLNLNVPEASTKNGTQIIQWKQPGAMNEQWETDGLGFGMIRNRWSRQCLTVDSKAAGAAVVQRPCEDSAAQNWARSSAQLDGGEPGYFYLRNSMSGLDLNVEGGSGQYGAKLIQWPRVPLLPSAMFSDTTQTVTD